MIGADCFDEFLAPCRTVTGWSVSAVLLIGGCAIVAVLAIVRAVRRHR